MRSIEALFQLATGRLYAGQHALADRAGRESVSTGDCFFQRVQLFLIGFALIDARSDNADKLGRRPWPYRCLPFVVKPVSMSQCSGAAIAACELLFQFFHAGAWRRQAGREGLRLHLVQSLVVGRLRLGAVSSLAIRCASSSNFRFTSACPAPPPVSGCCLQRRLESGDRRVADLIAMPVSSSPQFLPTRHAISDLAELASSEAALIVASATGVERWPRSRCFGLRPVAAQARRSCR